jgi:hypothetical protein
LESERFSIHPPALPHVVVLVNHTPAATIGWLVEKLQHPILSCQVQAFSVDLQQPGNGNTFVDNPRGQVTEVVGTEPQQSLLGLGTDSERPGRAALAVHLAEKSLVLYSIPFRIVQPLRRFSTRFSEISTPHLVQQIQEVVSAFSNGKVFP